MYYFFTTARALFSKFLISLVKHAKNSVGIYTHLCVYHNFCIPSKNYYKESLIHMCGARGRLFAATAAAPLSPNRNFNLP